MNQKIHTIIDEVISKITPSKDEVNAAKKATEQTIKRINASLKRVGAKASVQGSFQKNTQLKHTFDIDIFVHFNYKKYASGKQSISDILEEKLKKNFKNAERLHGSRDYFQIKKSEYVFELVPILDIKSSHQAKNITDVSPLHAKWVARKSKNIQDEIRLAKIFLKAQNIYGAESYVRGFSGYSCEVLTIYYGSFLKLLQAAAKKWKSKQIIDPENVYKNSNPLLILNKSKTVSPLVLIDPVQSSRNVTAALSDEAYKIFIKTAKNFLSRPSKSFFIRKVSKKEDLKKLKAKSAHLLLIEIEPEPNKHDVIGASIFNKYEFLKSQLTEHKFKVRKSSWFWEKGEKGAMWFVIAKRYPPKYEIRAGPSVKDKINSKRFKSKHNKTITKRGKLYASVQRKFTTPRNLVSHILRQKNFKHRTKLIKVEWH